VTSYRGGAVAFPLGGLGTGNVSLGADGSLRQWEIHNRINHRGDVPETLFAIRTSCADPPDDQRRLLRARPRDAATVAPAPLVSDHEPASWPSRPRGWEPVESTDFSATYPFARIEYHDASLPLGIALEAHTPFVPLDERASSLPVIEFRFTIANPGSYRRHGWLVGTLLGTVGWDGVTPIEGNACPLFGGNTATVDRRPTGTSVRLEQPGLDPTDPAWGSQAIWTDAPVRVLPRARSAHDVLRWVDTLGLVTPMQLGTWDEAALRMSTEGARPTMRDPAEASPPGQSWVTGLAAAFSIGPGETTEITFAHAWWFPNRVVDFDQFGPPILETEPTRLGNSYALPFRGADEVVDRWLVDRPASRALAEAWAETWSRSSLDPVVAETLGAQATLVRSPSVFVTADGIAFGFEGGLGASTRNFEGDVGGSCPLDCTHVWNYAQAFAAMYPMLERTMRDVEWDVLQAPEGYLPHRVRLPLDGRQFHGVPIGGPLDPAVDGMLGAILKTYRDARSTGDRPWLAGRWPSMLRLMRYVSEHWADADGVLRGRQPVTFDIDLSGPNMYVGGLWLAALRTMATVASLLEDTPTEDDMTRRSGVAAAAYDASLWNGSYYAQDSEGTGRDFGDGCLSDQLLGQWWAHQLDLGHLLPVEHVRSALTSIVEHNLRDGVDAGLANHRVFADPGDRGLVVCSWPRGGRPEAAIRYADEVWSGSEYQVAAHCRFEGLVSESDTVLAAVRARQSGLRRNPFNEIECGDHYVRAMSAWSLLQASTGFSHDALTGHLRAPTALGRWPFLAGSAWGTVEVEGGRTRISPVHGELTVRSVATASGPRTAETAWTTSAPVIVPVGRSLVVDVRIDRDIVSDVRVE
jgi:Glycosyl-hydrolase family 116, catalytic region/beta-glucosidase 2, glycosyl-hydrolase family 116 N-term